MATTTNFGWDTPDDTDLVKDGALAIRTLGSSIDTSFVDLKGGTTGQVLSKASNTDLDYTWVTTDDANAIQNAIVDAKGDLIAASAADTPARLAVGNNGDSLVADSAASTGLRWQSNTSGGKNFAINGNMVIAQRGTAAINLSTSFQYPVDRFWATANLTGTAQQISSISLDGFKNAVRLQRTAGNTSTNDLTIGQTFETNGSIPLQGKTVTLSFWARAGANYSASSSGLNARVYTGTGTDQGGYGFSWTGTALPVSATKTLTTSWQRFSVTGTISTSATQAQIYIFYTPSGTAGAADYFDITGVQLEIGDVATAFQTATGTLQGELAACQRYYYRTTATGQAYQLFTGFGSAVSTTSAIVTLPVPTKMRVSPTSVDFSTLALSPDNGTVIAATNATAQTGVGDAINISITSTGLTQFRPYQLLANNSTSAFIGVSAEL